MSIQNEVVRFIAEIDLDPQDKANFLQDQAAKLLTHQGEIVSATYKERTGRLTESLNHLPYPSGGKIEVKYPKHIRFLVDTSRLRSTVNLTVLCLML